MKAYNEAEEAAPKGWDIHPYYRRELAMAYAPELSPEAAVNRLKQWLQFNPALTEELRRHGYRPRQRMFTPAQVEVIFRYLGRPC